MRLEDLPIPAPPDYAVDWPALLAAFPSLAGLAGCPQDPTHHAEGDVLIHTEMVARAMARIPEWRALPPVERAISFLAALLHDLGKPACTRVESDGRITSRGHSRRGEIMVRGLLYRAGLDPMQREQICALIRFHQVPFYLIEHDDPARTAYSVSWIARCDHLALVAEADARGRDCADQARILDNVALFGEYCRERDCFHNPRSFPSDHSRFLYFRKPGRDPAHLAHDDTRLEVILMSGLPGAGKNTWIARHAADRATVSLDDIRAEIDVDPGEALGRVVHLAEERARELLRREQPFILNATHLGRELRTQWINLLAAYHARVRIVYVESPEAARRKQNQRRDARVPERVIDRMMDRWEVPDRTEAHVVEWAGPSSGG